MKMRHGKTRPWSNVSQSVLSSRLRAVAQQVLRGISGSEQSHATSHWQFLFQMSAGLNHATNIVVNSESKVQSTVFRAKTSASCTRSPLSRVSVLRSHLRGMRDGTVCE